MPQVDHDEIIDASKTYTHKALARILGRDERWVVEKLIYGGLDFYTIGQTHFVSGHAFLLFIERNAQPCPEEEDALPTQKSRSA